jgi:hypothetical protein
MKKTPQPAAQKLNVYPFALWDLVQIPARKPIPELSRLFQWDILQTVCITSMHAVTEYAVNAATMMFIERSILSYCFSPRQDLTPATQIPLSFLHTHLDDGFTPTTEHWFTRGMRTANALPVTGMQQLRTPEYLLADKPPHIRILSESGLIAEDYIRVVLFLDGYTSSPPYQIEADRIAGECNIIAPPK